MYKHVSTINISYRILTRTISLAEKKNIFKVNVTYIQNINYLRGTNFLWY